MGSLSSVSREIQAILQPFLAAVAHQVLSKVVLPNPAGEETSVSSRRTRVSSRLRRCRREMVFDLVGGMYNFVVRSCSCRDIIRFSSYQSKKSHPTTSMYSIFSQIS